MIPRETGDPSVIWAWTIPPAAVTFSDPILGGCGGWPVGLAFVWAAIALMRCNRSSRASARCGLCCAICGRFRYPVDIRVQALRCGESRANLERRYFQL